VTVRDQSQDSTDIDVYTLAERLRAGIRKATPEIMISLVGVAEVAEALLASRPVVNAAVHWDAVFDQCGDFEDWKRDDEACSRLSDEVKAYVKARRP
jgi:hypothetical protein